MGARAVGSPLTFEAIFLKGRRVEPVYRARVGDTSCESQFKRNYPIGVYLRRLRASCAICSQGRKDAKLLRMGVKLAPAGTFRPYKDEKHIPAERHAPRRREIKRRHRARRRVKAGRHFFGLGNKLRFAFVGAAWTLHTSRAIINRLHKTLRGEN